MADQLSSRTSSTSASDSPRRRRPARSRRVRRRADRERSGRGGPRLCDRVRSRRVSRRVPRSHRRAREEVRHEGRHALSRRRRRLPEPIGGHVMKQVEHTFVVAVPVERAWSAFTDSHERSQWEAPEYEIDPQPGGKLHWRIPPWPTVEGEVLEVDPNRRLVMSEGEGVLDGATRITVTFESVDDGTRITVVQAGFGDGARWQDRARGPSLRLGARHPRSGPLPRDRIDITTVLQHVAERSRHVHHRDTSRAPGDRGVIGRFRRRCRRRPSVTCCCTSTVCRSSNARTCGRSRSRGRPVSRSSWSTRDDGNRLRGTGTLRAIEV